MPSGRPHRNKGPAARLSQRAAPPGTSTAKRGPTCTAEPPRPAAGGQHRAAPRPPRGLRFLCRSSTAPTRNAAPAAAPLPAAPSWGTHLLSARSPDVTVCPRRARGCRSLTTLAVSRHRPAVLPWPSSARCPCSLTPLPVAALCPLCPRPCPAPWPCRARGPHGRAVPITPVTVSCPQSHRCALGGDAGGRCSLQVFSTAQTDAVSAFTGHGPLSTLPSTSHSTETTHSHPPPRAPRHTPARPLGPQPPPHSPRPPLGSSTSSLQRAQLGHAGWQRWAQQSVGSPVPGRLSAGFPHAPLRPHDV